MRIQGLEQTSNLIGQWRKSCAKLHIVNWIWAPIIMFVITRLGIILVAYIAYLLILDSDPPPYHLHPSEHVLLDIFGSRWDTGFYVYIAKEGYTYQGERFPPFAFFPLLPLLMRMLDVFIGDMVSSGLIVTNIALLGATLFFYRLVMEEWDTGVANRAVWYLLIFPTSFFGSAIYSESIFLFCAVGALYCARKGYWESAALLGTGATLSRFIGLTVAPMLLIEWWMQRRRATEQRPPLAALLAPLVVPLGTVAYMLYLNYYFYDPLAFFHASEVWEREPRSPLELLAPLLQTPSEGWGAALQRGHLPLDQWIDALAILAGLVLGIILSVQRRWSESMFVLLGASIPLSSGLLMSQRRYVWVLFPIFILLARWGKHLWVDRILTLIFILGLALFTALFANGYWVG